MEAVILGIAPELYVPALHPIDLEPVHAWWQRASVTLLYTLTEGRRVPAWITPQYGMELETVRRTLLEHGVTIHRPVPITPGAEEPPGLGQMFARDPIMAVGHTLIVGHLQIDMRRKEQRGFEPFLRTVAGHSTCAEAVTAHSVGCLTVSGSVSHGHDDAECSRSELSTARSWQGAPVPRSRAVLRRRCQVCDRTATALVRWVPQWRTDLSFSISPERLH